MQAGYGPNEVQPRGEHILMHLASTQHGVISKRDALAHLPATTIQRRVTHGTWERWYPGVYRLHAAPHTWHQEILAAIFAWGADVRASRGSAARLHELPHFANADIELLVPRNRKRALAHHVHRPSSLLIDADKDIVDAVPVTSAARTLIDLAATTDPDILEDALDHALRTRMTSIKMLRWRLGMLGTTGRAGTRRLEELLALRDDGSPPAESPLETRALRTIRRARLPLPVRQHRVALQGATYRIDLAYVAEKIALELDSYTHHSGRRAFENDRKRQDALTVDGWRFLRITDQALRMRPQEILAAIARLRDGRPYGAVLEQTEDAVARDLRRNDRRES